jgi:pimeloyl-ACP methyl ester carboxylesterase
VTESSIEVGPRGLALRMCEWSGDAEAPADGPRLPPVLVLHGFLEQGAAWDAVARRLERRVVAPDQRGHGRSDHVGPGGWYHFWDYVGDVDAIVRRLGAPIDLVGHSMGGTVACLYAGARPENVRRLVLVEGLGPPDTTDQAVQRAREFLRDRQTPPTHGTLRDLDDAVARMRRSSYRATAAPPPSGTPWNPALGPEAARLLAERVTTRTDGGLAWSWDPLHRGRSPTPFSAAQFVAFLREIRAPVLLVDGGRSPFVIPDREQRVAALAGEVREVVLPDAGHLVHHDDPEGLARVIRAFLDAS